MTLRVNEADPCAAAASLRQIYYALIAGHGAMSVSFRGGVSGVERTVTYHRADPDRLLSVIRGFEEQCARLQGSRPRRFALATGGIR